MRRGGLGPGGIGICAAIRYAFNSHHTRIKNKPEQGERLRGRKKQMKNMNYQDEDIDPRYDASDVDGYGFLRDMRNTPESRFPDVDLTDMSASDRDAVCAYLRDDDGSLSEDDQEFCGEIADEVEALDAEE